MWDASVSEKELELEENEVLEEIGRIYKFSVRGPGLARGVWKIYNANVANSTIARRMRKFFEKFHILLIKYEIFVIK